MRGDKKGFGSWIYLEWVYPIRDYFISSCRNEILFEIIMPVIISIVVTVTCILHHNVSFVVVKLANVLLTLTSILIGFSVMLVTLLLTSGGDGVKLLKEKKMDKKLYRKEISLYQKLHIQFVYSLIGEISLLIIVLLFYFIQSIAGCGLWQVVFLLVFIMMILNILLSILRGITNVYFSYYLKG